jgi:formylglycine-generating enzyme required for sulfatase activity
VEPKKLTWVWAFVLVGCGGAQAPAPPSSPSVAKTEAPPPVAEPAAEAQVLVSEAPAAAPAAEKAEHGPSCDGRTGAGNDCGSGESCCARALVPEGDVLYRRLDMGPGEKKHVGAFYLDRYEVTVGRFRSWVAAGQPAPKAGDVIYDDGQGHTLKWPEKAKIQDAAHLEGWKRYDTWTGGNDLRPKNFVTWFTAEAFCRWEGGRLPTDVEWTRAARGGEEDRPYPWGNEAPTPELAVYDCMGDGNQSCALIDIQTVGSRPKGVGRWGQYDLAGSMFEWTLQPGRVAGAATSTEKARGGGFCYIGGVDRRTNTDLRPAVFREESPETVSHMTGVRCAYDVPPGTKPAEKAPSQGGGGRPITAK